MEFAKPLENLDSIFCEKHNGNIILLSLEKADNIKDHLLCVDCIEEKTRMIYSLPWKDVKALIQEQQQSKLHENQTQLRATIDLIRSLGSIVNQIKSNLISNLDQIISTTSNWMKEIDEHLSRREYSFFKELETYIKIQQKTEINFIDDSRIKELQKCNQYNFQKIKGYFKQISTSLDFSSLQSTISQIFMVQGLNLICSKHKMQISMININKGIPLGERTLCFKCQQQNSITIQSFEERWINYQQSGLQKQQIQNQDLQLILKRVQQMNESCNNQMLQIVNFIKSHINQSSQNKQNFKISQFTLKTLQIYAEELSLNEIDQRNLCNTQEYQQLNVKIQTQLCQFNNSILNQINELNKILITKIGVIAIKLEKTDEISQSDTCCAVAFNKDNSLMVASSLSEIQIWRFQNGKLQNTPNKLSGHNKQVYCLVFSKHVNWFFSGSHDQTIRCWKEIKNAQWVSSESYNQHNDYVLCLLLNKNEDQLFSCSADKSIRVWNADYHKNKLIYHYSLDKHTDWVCSISLNQQESELVSCSLDKSIILWFKGNQKWEFKYILQQSICELGYRICFIDDNIIAWQQDNKGTTSIFKKENGVFVEKLDLRILFNQVNEDGWLFPSVYNKERQIFIQKHNKFVYIMRYLNDGLFENQYKFIDCNSQMNYGGLTQDGLHLIIWDQQTKQFRIYNI